MTGFAFLHRTARRLRAWRDRIAMRWRRMFRGRELAAYDSAVERAVPTERARRGASQADEAAPSMRTEAGAQTGTTASGSGPASRPAFKQPEPPSPEHLRRLSGVLERIRDSMLLKHERQPKLPAPPKAPPSARVAKASRWESESMRAGTGHIDLAPWVPPERTYKIFVPPVLAPAPCVVLMLHGCRQTSEEIAEGTRLNEHAEERGWIVVYPEQTKAANKYNCWNWFDPANERGEGECAVVVAIHEAVRNRLRIPRGRTFLAGMSAGGALVSLLAFRYSRLWAGVGIHSGLPYGAARDPWGAQRAMREGAGGLDAAMALRARVPQAAQLPAIVMHGNEDDVVHRRNADLLVRQFLGWNGYLADAPDWAKVMLPSVVTTEMSTTSGHAYVLRDYVDPERAPVRECEVVGMGHAWSGGDGALPYHDEMGPDASALMMEFFSGVAER